MQCKKLSAAGDQLLDPTSSAWSAVPAEELTMAGTPLANQPSGYIKASRDEKLIGKIRALNVQAAHNGQEIFFRLSWGDESQNVAITDSNQFPDGCGILIPMTNADTPIDEMGGRDAPVNAWYWRADFKDDKAMNQVAHGLGSTVPSKETPMKARGVWNNGVWSVVFARPLTTTPEIAKEEIQLASGQTVKIGFAIWEGGSGERAGVKSFSKEWRDLALEA